MIKFNSDNAQYDATEILSYLDMISNSTSVQKLKAFSQNKDVTNAIVFADIIDHFQKEMGPDGAWKKWAPSYAAQMQRAGKGGDKILQRTGRLRNSFQRQSNVANARISRGNIVWFNSSKTNKGFPYAYAHDNDDAARSQLPRRAFMWISDNALNKLGNIMLKFVANGGSFKKKR